MILNNKHNNGKQYTQNETTILLTMTWTIEQQYLKTTYFKIRNNTDNSLQWTITICNNGSEQYRQYKTLKTMHNNRQK